MEIILASAAGLLAWRGEWRKIPTPLAHPTLLTPCETELAVADSFSRQLYRQGRIRALPPGVVAIRSWRNQLLLLSSETNCLTLCDAHDNPQVTSPAGIRPSDCCVCGSFAVVCGGDDGCLHIFSLPDLREISAFPVPGCPMRVIASDGVLTGLSLLSPDPPQSLLFRFCPANADFAPVALLPGLCGALAMAADGSLWVAVGEQLLHFPLATVVPDVRLGGFGLITSLSCRQSQLLMSDSWAGRCLLMSTHAPYTPHLLYAGECGACCFASCRKGTLPDWKASLNEPEITR